MVGGALGGEGYGWLVGKKQPRVYSKQNSRAILSNLEITLLKFCHGSLLIQGENPAGPTPFQGWPKPFI